MTSGSDSWRHSNIGRLLNNAVSRFESRVFELLAERGHREVRVAHLHLTRNLDVAGTRVTELARRAAMTKQGMAEIVGQCEELGLVRRIPDPTDGRAKTVVFTDSGRDWLDAFREAVKHAEAELREELGGDETRDLKAALRAYGARFDTLST